MGGASRVDRPCVLVGGYPGLCVLLASMADLEGPGGLLLGFRWRREVVAFADVLVGSQARTVTLEVSGGELFVCWGLPMGGAWW